MLRRLLVNLCGELDTGSGGSHQKFTSRDGKSTFIFAYHGREVSGSKVRSILVSDVGLTPPGGGPPSVEEGQAVSEELHVVYRHVGPSSWEVYSRPVSIHTDGQTLQEAREEFTAVAEDHFGADWPAVSIVEHRELMVMPGVFVRIATDRHTLDREKVAQVFRESLTVPVQWEMLQKSDVPVSSTGDVVFLACVDSDPLPWVTGQLGRGDALQVACLRDVNAVWWMPLAAPDAELNQPSETLAQAGLSSPTSTVADVMEVITDPVVAPGAPRTASSVPTPVAPVRGRLRRRKKTGQGSGLVRSRRRALVAA